MRQPFDNEKAVNIYTNKTELFPVEKEMFDRYLKRVGVVVDLGAGTGRTTKHIHELGNHVLASDISPLMVERAKELHPDLCFEVLNACNLPYMNNSVDAVVFSFNGLDCVYPELNRVEAVKEIRRILKSGGVFIYSSHNVEATGWRSRRAWSHRPRHYRGHYYREQAVYGELILFYGSLKYNLDLMRSLGFLVQEYQDHVSKGWRLYVAVKEDVR